MGAIGKGNTVSIRRCRSRMLGWGVLAPVVVLSSLLLPGMALAGGLISLRGRERTMSDSLPAGYGARAQDTLDPADEPGRDDEARRHARPAERAGPLRMGRSRSTKAVPTILGTGDGGNHDRVPAGRRRLHDIQSLGQRQARDRHRRSNFGLAEEYDSDWAGRYYVQKAALIGMSVMPSVAFKLSDKVSLGLTLNAMYGIPRRRGRRQQPPFFAGADGQLNLEDRDLGLRRQHRPPVRAQRRGPGSVSPTASEVKLDFTAPSGVHGAGAGPRGCPGQARAPRRRCRHGDRGAAGA